MFHRRFSVVVNHQLQIAEHFLVKHAIDSCLSVDGADLVSIFLDIDVPRFFIIVSHCLTSICLPVFVDLCMFDASEI